MRKGKKPRAVGPEALSDFTLHTSNFVVPRLRFPEFRGLEGWEKTHLGAEAAFQKGRGVSKADLDQNGNHLCIRYGELYTRYGEVIRNVFSRTSAPDSDLFLSRKNDVIVPASGETKADIATAACVLLDDVALGSDLNVIRSEHNGVFLSYFLNGPKRGDISKVAQGDTVVHLYPKQLADLSIAFPDAAEQQKIADCLTSLDEVIAAQGREVEALNAHKRGLMQQLFPREGETLPRLRFPEFRGAPEWKAKCLEEVAPLQRGFDLPSTQLEAGNIPVVYSNGIRSYHNVGMARGPGLVTGRSGTIGNLHYIDEGDYWPHNTSLWVTDFKGHDPKFVYFLYTAIGLDRFASGSGVPTLNRNDVHSFETRVPGTTAEQRRIADLLSTLDTQITAETDQLVALKTHKQGLMQQLFPSSGGVARSAGVVASEGDHPAPSGHPSKGGEFRAKGRA